MPLEQPNLLRMVLILRLALVAPGERWAPAIPFPWCSAMSKVMATLTSFDLPTFRPQDDLIRRVMQLFGKQVVKEVLDVEVVAAMSDLFTRKSQGLRV